MYTLTTPGKGNIEEVLNLSQKVFHETFARDILAKEENFEYNNARIIIDESGSVVSTVFVIPRIMYMDSVELKLGGIGGVATDPSCRGKGYAGLLMKDAVDFMKQEHYDLSLLFPYSKDYYAKFGYRDYCPEIHSVPAAQSALKNTQNINIREYSPAVDFDRVLNLYNSYCLSCIGPVKRSRAYLEQYLKKNENDIIKIFVAENKGQLYAYGMYGKMKKGAKADTWAAKMLEYSFLHGRKSAMDLIFSAAMKEAAAEGHQLFYYEPLDNYSFEGSQPADHEKTIELDNKHLKMFRVIDFGSLFKKLKPLWDKRCGADIEKHFEFSYSSADYQGAAVIEGLESGFSMRLEEKEFTGILLGFSAFSSLRAGSGFTPGEKELLNKIFPAKKPVFWDFDYL